ncbi:AbrB/MazE/SpoVT family DNA-binding domain-containing protein [Natrinema sp. DC36]|uniref:AbrB/MazE/SpoVT family DNA-binding domain-containing protein n=1 Tax=Natrinema sp. DC36 TaxID=2878680 RepID=UPI001CF0654A|nr:AbrB/MazE/SpoVT family DNA-binding domain-containing protein [Natrinema sp. DC36]
MTDDGTDCRLDENGTIALPKRIRGRINLEPGDRVRVDVEDGRIVLRPRLSRSAFADAMRGCLTEESTIEDAPSIDPTNLRADWLSDCLDE